MAGAWPGFTVNSNGIVAVVVSSALVGVFTLFSFAV
jgi:hypothetical protein